MRETPTTSSRMVNHPGQAVLQTPIDRFIRRVRIGLPGHHEAFFRTQVTVQALPETPSRR